MNGYDENIWGLKEWCRCLILGPVYFAMRGIWGMQRSNVRSALRTELGDKGASRPGGFPPNVAAKNKAALVLAILTCGISWLIYPFSAPGILRKHYLQKGWIPVG